MSLNIAPTLNVLGEHAIEQALAHGGLGKIATIAFGSARYAPTGTETALVNEVVRAQIETVVHMGQHVEVSATLTAPVDFEIGEVAFLLEDDTPFAIWSEDADRLYPKLDMVSNEQIIEDGVPQTRPGRPLATVSAGTEIPFRYVIDIGADGPGRITVLTRPLNEAYAILSARVDGLEGYLDHVPEFGGVGDGVTDDTQAVLDADAFCVANGKRLILTRPYAVTEVDLKSEVDCVLGGGLIPLAVDVFTVTLSSPGCNHGDLRVEGDQSHASLLKIMGANSSAQDIYLSGLHAREGGANQFGMVIAAPGFDQKGTTYIKNFTKDENVGDVWPQGVALWGGSDKARLGHQSFRNCVSGFIPGPEAVTYTVKSLEGVDLSDNLFYATGGSGSVGPIRSQNVQEPVVHKGGYVSIGSIHATGQSIRVVGLDRATGVLDVGPIQLGPDAEGNSPNQIWGLRSGNAGNTCPGLRIASVTGVFSGYSVWQAHSDNGKVSEVEIGSMTLTMNYDGGAGAVPSYFMQASGIEGIKVGRSTVSIVDRTGASSDVFRLTLPALTKPSQIDGLFVDCVLQSGQPGGHVFRGSNAAQEHMRVIDGIWHNLGSTPVLREVSYGPCNTINGKPAGGFWQKATRLWELNPDNPNNASYYECTADGVAPNNWSTK